MSNDQPDILWNNMSHLGSISFGTLADRCSKGLGSAKLRGLGLELLLHLRGRQRGEEDWDALGLELLDDGLNLGALVVDRAVRVVDELVELVEHQHELASILVLAEPRVALGRGGARGRGRRLGAVACVRQHLKHLGEAVEVGNVVLGLLDHEEGGVRRAVLGGDDVPGHGLDLLLQHGLVLVGREATQARQVDERQVGAVVPAQLEQHRVAIDGALSLQRLVGALDERRHLLRRTALLEHLLIANDAPGRMNVTRRVDHTEVDREAARNVGARKVEHLQRDALDDTALALGLCANDDKLRYLNIKFAARNRDQ